MPQVALRKVDGAEILRRVEKYGVTVMCAAPAVVAAVLDAAPSWEGEIPGRDRTRIIVAGAPPPTKTVARVEAELGWEFIQIYGLTETSPLLTVNRGRQEWDDLEPEERAAQAGARRHARHRGDAQGRRRGRGARPLQRRASRATGSSRRRPAKALAGGWFHTGDGGFIDDDGYLTIADRKKDVIITGGENVSSIEVEDAIFSHPDVAEVAVIGVPDEKWGETIKALVVKAEGSELTEQELIDYVKSRGRPLQGPDVGRVPRRPRPHRHREAAEVQAARAVLGGPRAPGQLRLSPVVRLSGAPTGLWGGRPIKARNPEG